MPGNDFAFEIARIEGIVRERTRIAVAAALAEIEEKVVTDARALAPVRKAFKNPSKARKKSRGFTGKYAYLDEGFGSSVMLKRRQTLSKLNKLNRGGLVLGQVTHKGTRTSGEIESFKSKNATRFETEGRRVPSRTGSGSRVQTTTGYKLKSSYRQRALTARARYALTHGIGVHEMATGTGQKTLVFGGTLRESIHGRGVEPIEGGFLVRIVADARREDGVPYAKYVEYGTYKDYAQPFMRPAIKNARRYSGAIIKKHLAAGGMRRVQG